MELGLAGRAAVVGGASQGIGFAIASMLAGEGVDVAIVARRADALNAAAARINEAGRGRAVPIAADIRNAEDCERIVASAAETFGRLDILVNNDGAPPLGQLLDFDDVAWDKAIQQNLMSVVRLCRSAVPHMLAQGGGRIVNITALSVLQPMPRFGLSVATWAAAMAFAKTLSLEVATEGVTVNSVCPGRIGTERLAKVFGDGNVIAQERLDEMSREIPMRRIGEPDDIASLVTFLASDHADYITGATFHVDGGRLARVM